MAIVFIGLVSESQALQLSCAIMVALSGITLDIIFVRLCLSEPPRSGIPITPAIIYCVSALILSRIFTSSKLIWFCIAAFLFHVMCQIAIPELSSRIWRLRHGLDRKLPDEVDECTRSNNNGLP